MGYPAKSDEKGILERISGYVNCFTCCSTFIYGNSSGTTHLKQHSVKCSQTTNSSITIEDNDSPPSSSSSSQSILARHGFKKLVKLNQRDMDNIKKLSAKWVCHNLRPFCTLEDVGFRVLAQELVNIGMFILVFNCQICN